MASEHGKNMRRIRRRTARLIRRGAIKKPLRCSECKKKVRLTAHHMIPIGARNITWLCHSCHRKAHLDIPLVAGYSRLRLNLPSNRKSAVVLSPDGLGKMSRQADHALLAGGTIRQFGLSLHEYQGWTKAHEDACMAAGVF